MANDERRVPADGEIGSSGLGEKPMGFRRSRSYPQALITVAKNGQGLAKNSQGLAKNGQGLAKFSRGIAFQPRRGEAWRVPNSNINSNITGNKGETTMRGRTGNPSRE